MGCSNCECFGLSLLPLCLDRVCFFLSSDVSPPVTLLVCVYIFFYVYIYIYTPTVFSQKNGVGCTTIPKKFGALCFQSPLEQHSSPQFPLCTYQQAQIFTCHLSSHLNNPQNQGTPHHKHCEPPNSLPLFLFYLSIHLSSQYNQ